MVPKKYQFDVIIVGGGPAGLSAAAEAAKKEIKVAILEKDPSIASSIRTSGITWLSEIEDIHLPKDFYNPINQYELYSPHNTCIQETAKAEACILDVRRLYHLLAHRASANGAELFLRTQVTSASYENNKRAITIQAASPLGSLTFRGSIVIDASGFSSILGRKLGFIEEYSRFGVGAEFEAYAEKVKVHSWSLLVGQPYSPAGYAWILPIEENKVRVGVGVGRPESTADPLSLLYSLLENRPGPLKELGRICPIESHVGVVPNQGPRELSVADCLLLVGDSAGHVNPLLLEGIRFALKYGRLAGKIANKAINKEAVYKSSLEAYEKRWKHEVWSDFQIGGKLQSRYLSWSDEHWDKEVAFINSLSSTDMLNLFKCNFSLKNLIKLASKYPRFRDSAFFSIVSHKKVKNRKCRDL